MGLFSRSGRGSRFSLSNIKSRLRVASVRIARRQLLRTMRGVPFEKLEDRHLLAAAVWDGGGDKQRWNDPLNWVGNVLPQPGDTVTIEDPSSNLVVTVDALVNVASISSTEHIWVKNAELRTGPLSASDLTFENGTLNPATGATLSATISNRLSIIGSASQFMILGNMQVGGELDLRPDLTITANGSNARLQVAGVTDINGVNLVAQGGGLISIPGAREYRNTSTFNDNDRLISATGTGSRIQLTGVKQIVGGTHNGADIRIEARSGGTIDLSGVTQIDDQSTGDVRSRQIDVLATGTGSFVDLASLKSMRDRSTDQPSTITTTVGGRVSLSSLESVAGLQLTLDANSTTPLAMLKQARDSSFILTGATFSMPLLTTADGSSFTITNGNLVASNLQSLVRGSIEIGSGATADFNQLSRVDGANFTASGGSTLALPGVVRYAVDTSGSSQFRRWRATGSGSVLSMPNLQSIEGADDYDGELSVDAAAGGRIALPALKAMTDANRGDTRQRKFLLSADGANSRLELNQLQSIVDLNVAPNSGFNQGEYSIVRWTNGGDVVAPVLASIHGVDITFEGVGSILASQLTHVTDSRINVKSVNQQMLQLVRGEGIQFTVTGATLDVRNLTHLNGGAINLATGGSVNFASLTNIDGASISVSGGALLSLPGVVTYQHAATTTDVHRSWTVTGASSRLDMPALRAITGGGFYNNRHFVSAQSGGTINLPALKTIDDRAEGDTRQRSIELDATGTNSIIIVSALTQFIDRDVNPNSGFNAGLYSRLSATVGGSILANQLIDIRGVEVKYDGTSSLAFAQFQSSPARTLIRSRLVISGSSVSLPQLTSADGTEFVIAGVNVSLPVLETLRVGGLNISAGGSLSAPLLSNIDGTSITVKDGVVLTLPNIEHYRFANTNSDQSRLWRSEGAGTRLELPALFTIVGGSDYNNDFFIQAALGGSIDLSAVTQILDPIDGDSRQRAFKMTATDPNSLIDLSNLTTLIDRNVDPNNGFNAGEYSTLDASTGGRITAPGLTQIRGLSLNIDTAGDVPVNSFDSLEDSTILINAQPPTVFTSLRTIQDTSLELTASSVLLPGVEDFHRSSLTVQSGAIFSAPNVVSIDGSSFNIRSGVVSFPNVTAYELDTSSDTQTRTWRAEGAGSRLDLSALKWIRGGDYYGNFLDVLATSGGAVDLKNVQQIVDPYDGDTRQRRYTFTADGAGSQLFLNSLQNLIDRNSAPNNGFNAGLYSSLIERNGGQLIAPNLRTLVNVEYTSQSGTGQIDGDGKGPTAGLSGFGEGPSFARVGATATWVGGNGNWNTATSWSIGRVPGPFDRVVLPTSGVTVTISTGAQSVRSLNGAGSLSITGGSLTVTESSRLTGTLLVSPAASVSAIGPNALFEVTGAATINGANLTASWGAVIRFPTVTQYSHASTANDQTRSWLVEGLGSRIELPALTKVINGTHYNSQMNISILAGGSLQVPTLTSIEDGPSGDTRQRALNIYIEGPGSLFDAPLLNSFTDNDVNPNSGFNAGLYSNLNVRDGGEFRSPGLVNVAGVAIIRDSVSSINLAQITSFVRSTLTASGVSLSLSGATSIAESQFTVSNGVISLPQATSLTRGAITLRGESSFQAPLLQTINGTSLDVSNGAILNLPGVSSYDFAATANDQTRTWSVDGFGSQISLPDLQLIRGGSFYNGDMSVVAAGGGVLNLPAVTQVLDGVDGDTRQRSINFTASGLGSAILLDALTTFRDDNVAPNSGFNEGQYSTLTAVDTGRIHAPVLTSLQGIAVTQDGLGQLQTAQWSQLTSSRLTISQRDVNLNGLTSVTDTAFVFDRSIATASALSSLLAGSITLRGGGNFQLPALTSANGLSLDVDGGVTLDLTRLTDYQHAATANDVYRNWVARGYQTRIDLGGLTKITAGNFYNDRIYISAYSGAEIDLGAVTEIIDGTTGDTRQRAVIVRAEDADTLIDLRSMTAMRDRDVAPNNGFNAGLYSELVASNRATILLVGLKTLEGVTLTVESMANLAIPALQQLIRSQVTVTGGNYDLANLLSANESTLRAIDANFDIGQLAAFTGGNIQMESGGTLTAPALTNIDGTGLLVADGGYLELPLVTSYSHASTANGQLRQFRAKGYGSFLSLPNLISITGGTHYQSQMVLDAYDGAGIDMGKLETIQEATTGDSRQRSIALIADGLFSMISVPVLRTFTDVNQDPNNGFNAGLYSRIVTTRGGKLDAYQISSINGIEFIADDQSFYYDEVLGYPTERLVVATNSIIDLTGRHTSSFPLLTNADGTTIRISGASMFAPSLTRWVGGDLELTDGATANFASLSNINATSILLRDGVTLALPLVTSITNQTSRNSQRTSLRVEGPNSKLDLSNVISVTGGTHFDSSLVWEALSGGVIDLSSANSIGETNLGDQRNRRIEMLSEGVGSRIVMTALQSYFDPNAGSTSGTNRFSFMEARYGGEIALVTNPTMSTSLQGIYATVGLNGTISGRMQLENGSQLTGNGRIAGNLTVAGLVTPNRTLIITGGLTLLPSGILEFGIGGLVPGVDYDTMSVGGAADFRGTVRVLRENNHTPVAGNSYRAMTYGSRTGTPTYVGLDFGNSVRISPELAATQLEFVFGFSSGARVTDISGQIRKVRPISYTMPNGYSGSYNYWDDKYSGTGNKTQDGAELSGGLGDLTDGVIPTANWAVTEEPAGPGPYVGWTIDPVIQFQFAELQTFTSMRVHLDDADMGSVNAPSAIIVNGIEFAVVDDPNSSAPFFVDLDLSSLLPTDLLEVQLIRNGLWVFASEFEFNAIGTSIAVSQFDPTIQVSFSEAIDLSEFDASDISLVGPNGPVGFDGPFSVSDSLRDWEIRIHPGDYVDGEYEIVIGPNVLDLVGNPMNQDEDTVNGEPVEDQFRTRLLLALPDLSIASGGILLGATQLNFGDTLDISWSVTNFGLASANASTWADAVFLSKDPIYDGSDERLLVVGHELFLDPGAFYEMNRTATVPLTAASEEGTYYILVFVDYSSNLVESNENNIFVSEPITLSLPPVIDLKPTAITGPSDAQPGQTYTFTWTVTNQGQLPTVGTWTDQLYLSSFGSLECGTLIGSVVRNGILQPGESYTATLTVALPAAPDSTYQLLVVTDTNNQNNEGPFEDNNKFAGPTIRVTHPDIIVRDLTAPASASAGSEIAVGWNFLNAGSGTAQTWQQRIFLSDDQVRSSNDRMIDQYQVTTPLLAGATRAENRNVRLPVDISGAKFLLVVTDTLNQLGELSDGENNNLTFRLIDLVLAPYADLVVSNVTAPPLTIGDPADFTVAWTVTNAGNGRGLTDQWTDAIVLSPNAVAGDGDDIVVAQFVRTGGLDATQSYRREETFKLPPATNGRYNLFVRTDFKKEVFENGFESNNDVRRSGTVDIMPVENADLVVSSIDVALPVVAGQTLTATWTVNNQGIGITNRGDWFDVAYIATDAAGTQKVAGTEVQFQHFGQVAPTQSYARTGNISVPNGLQGNHYLVVQTAKRNGPFEFIYTTNNTSVSSVFPISLLPAPDLVVTSITAPAQAQEGNLVDIQWTVRNQGLGGANGVWRDRVYLQKAGDLNAEIIEVGKFEFRDPVAPGISYVRNEAIRIPTQASGVFNLFVDTNFEDTLYEGSGAANNLVAQPRLITINVKPRADLQVDRIEIPDRIESGATLAPQFVIVNQGSLGTGNTQWVDRVYLSLDTTIDSADLLIGQLPNSAALQAGERYSTEAGSVVVPLRFRGDVYVIVLTDATDRVDEWPNNTNNLRYRSIFVEPRPLADLVVSDVVAPSQAVNGAEIPVRYTVTNLGSGPTNGDTWAENVWLTRDKNRPHPGQGDILLRTLTHTGALARNAGYETSTTIKLPREIESGTWYVTPWVDPLDVILEDTLASNTNPDDPTNIDNNNYKARQILVIGSQPDLVVSQVVAPPIAKGGDSITVSWTVENRGLIGAEPGGWMDRIYLSDNPNPKAKDAKTMLLGEKKRTLPLAAGASYTDSMTIPLSPSAAGLYIAVITDDEVPTSSGIQLPGFFGSQTQQEKFNPVTEFNETNNTTAVAATVTAHPANLKVVSFDIPQTNYSGEDVTFSYTVRNIGTAPVWSGTNFWRDFIWLSADSTFIRDRASYLGSTVYSPSEVIDPGEQYTISFTTKLPEGTGGQYSLWVHLDAHNDLSPFFYPYQARLLIKEWFPANTGRNAEWLSHFDHWAFEDPSDNLARADLPVIYREADLAVRNVQLPPTASSGQTVPLTYTVENIGGRETRVSSWTDRIFISRDGSLDNFDHELAVVGRGGKLAAGASYTETVDIRIPDGIEGDFRIIVFADSAAQEDRARRPSDIGFGLIGIEFELPGSLAPWDLASSASRETARASVKEYQQEGNNIAARLLPITLIQPPDLQVSNVIAPLRGIMGQEIDVQYTVTNRGGNTVPGQTTWQDMIYLSRDQFLDLSSDLYLDTLEHRGDLLAGGAYTIGKRVSLPPGLLGPYYVFVITDPDSRSAKGKVFEGANERNNDLSGTVPMVIELPPPGDLQVTSVNVPVQVEAGQTVTFQWTVKNFSTQTITGRWSDRLFFSTNATWDLADVTAGAIEFRGTLGPGQSYTSTLTTQVPALSPGQYRAIVRADILNQVYEDINDSNNSTASASAMQLTVPFLTLDVPTSTTMATGQQRLFAVNVPPDATLRVTAIADDDSTYEVFLRANEAPTVRLFDASSGGSLLEVPAAVVPATNAGTYYVLLRGFSTRSNSSPVRVLAELLPLAITDIRTDIGGDSKFVTAKITGARFQPNAVVKLVRPGFAEITPVNQRYVSASEMIVTFDFEDAPRGLYDVQVINPGGQMAQVPYRFQIERTIEPDVTIGIGGPRFIFAGDQGTYSVALQNLGNVDAPYVYFNVGVPELGINDWVYNLPYLNFTSNLRGGPEGSLENLPWAELDSAMNTNGTVQAGGFVFDQPADGFAGFTFQVQTYPGLRELHDHAWEELKAKLYQAFPQYAAVDLLAPGPSALDLISPGLTLIWEVFGAVPDFLRIPKIPFQFHVVASSTTMNREEFIAFSLQEAEKIRQGILKDANADPALVNLAANESTWQSLYMTYLSESGRLRAEDAIPPTRRDQELASLIATLAGGVLKGPGGDQIIASGDLTDFFENVRKWYGHDPSLLAEVDTSAPDFSSDSLSFFGILQNANPIAKLPTFDEYDLGLRQSTNFQAMRVFVPWVPFDKRGAGIPADYQIRGITPNDESAFFPLNLQDFYDQEGQTSGGVSQTGPFTLETGGFIPANQALPFTINFQNDPNATRYANEVRVTVPLDNCIDPRSFRLGDIKVGDITIRMPNGRSFYQGDFDFAATLGFNVRVSAGVDLKTNSATWLIQAIDPLTGELRTNPIGGLLQPNNARGQGAGFVAYSVELSEAAATGAIVTANARVSMDNAAPEDAPALTYTADATAPASRLTVTPLNDEADFKVAWSVTDDANGSGFKHVTLYVSEDGKDFKIWKRQVTDSTGEDVYEGRVGHTYEFLALASDRAGNREIPPSGDTAPDDGSSTPLGDLPRVEETTRPNFGQAPTPTTAPSTNPLFVQAEKRVPSPVSPSNAADFNSVMQPFFASAFATGFDVNPGELVLVELDRWQSPKPPMESS